MAKTQSSDAESPPTTTTTSVPIYNGMDLGIFDPENPPQMKKVGGRFFAYPAADGKIRIVRAGKLFKVVPFVPKPAAVKKTRKRALKSAA